MTGEELGKLLGGAIGDLEGASMDIEDVISQLLDIDGKAILPKDADAGASGDKPHMTAEELEDAIDTASSGLDAIITQIEDAQTQLQGIDVTALSSDD